MEVGVPFLGGSSTAAECLGRHLEPWEDQKRRMLWGRAPHGNFMNSGCPVSQIVARLQPSLNKHRRFHGFVLALVVCLLSSQDSY